ncbi:MAG: hypothetical protein MJE77_40080 [Proteobacteria bacterium]|nr:hypothetical protein [Pseudomonadota bacterium]
MALRQTEFNFKNSEYQETPVANKKTTAKREKNTAGSTSAPGSFRGFSLQATRFLYYLLKVESHDVVSLEYFEDVGVEKSSGEKLAEQDKSFLSRNPLADRSVAFWKSFRNWVDAASARTLVPERSSFIIYAPNARMGRIVLAFDNASTIEEAKGVLQMARRALGGRMKGKTWDISQEAQEHVDIVLNTGSALAARIITRFNADVAGQDPMDALKPLLRQKLVSESSYNDVIRWANGWVKQKIDKLMSKGEHARIRQSDFQDALLNYVRTHDRVDILRSIASTRSKSEIETEIAIRNYVKQLQLIELDDIDLYAAVSDYLSASADRAQWSEDGLISEESMMTLERELGQTWRNKRRRVRINHEDKDEKDQGQLLYSECMEHRANVDGLETPSQFIRGSWHALSDDQTVGWHPRYKEELASSRP